MVTPPSPTDPGTPSTLRIPLCAPGAHVGSGLSDSRAAAAPPTLTGAFKPEEDVGGTGSIASAGVRPPLLQIGAARGEPGPPEVTQSRK